MRHISRSTVAILALGLIVCSGTALAADDKSNADKIVGSWKLDRTPNGPLPEGLNIVATFEKGGKISVRSSFMGKKDAKSGTYKVDGNKLTITLTGEKEETETIKTLDDKKLVTVSSKGKTSEFKKTENE